MSRNGGSCILLFSPGDSSAYMAFNRWLLAQSVSRNSVAIGLFKLWAILPLRQPVADAPPSGVFSAAVAGTIGGLQSTREWQSHPQGHVVAHLMLEPCREARPLSVRQFQVRTIQYRLAEEVAELKHPRSPALALRPPIVALSM